MAPGFIQKVESQIQEHSRTFLGGKQFFSRTFPARHPHILFTILYRAISSRETKSLTEVGAVKNVNNANGYYRKNNRHSVLLRAEEMNVQR